MRVPASFPVKPLRRATDFDYCKVTDLQCGTPIFLYGWRNVIDVHNVPETQGGPQKVRLVTSDGTFLIDRNALIAMEQD